MSFDPRFAGWLLHAKEFFAMCDYSLHSVRTRPAKIGDKLVTRDFGTGTRGFASVADLNIAVCLLPGTELAFASEVTYADWNVRSLIKARLAVRKQTHYQTAIFRQINKETMTHHDALEFPTDRLCFSPAYPKARRQPSYSSQRGRALPTRRGNKSVFRSSPKRHTIISNIWPLLSGRLSSVRRPPLPSCSISTRPFIWAVKFLPARLF